MGAGGVAQVIATAGYPVKLQDIGDAPLSRGMGAIKESLERLVARDKLKPEARGATLQRITPTTRILAATEVVADLVGPRLGALVEQRREARGQSADRRARKGRNRRDSRCVRAVPLFVWRKAPQEAAEAPSRRKPASLARRRLQKDAGSNEAIIHGRHSSVEPSCARLLKHRRRMARDEALLVGRDDPDGNR